jgi:hypothetical protein
MAYTIQSARYANPENTSAIVMTTESGAVAISQRDKPDLWTQLQSSGIPVSPYTLPAPIARDIKEEAQRRILARFPEWRQFNLTMRFTELLRKGEALWTAAERADATAFQGAWDWIKSVRAASNTLEASLPPDYQDDRHWPAQS